MDLWSFLLAALFLSVERICYAWVWRFPDMFCRLCTLPWLQFLGGPIDVLRKLFFGFKGLQLSVFFGWCYFYGNGTVNPLTSDIVWLGLGALLIIIGQGLNLSVFLRLGEIGVFYGNRFGYYVPWCQGFPFSLFRHPQYIGTVLSIWGFFLAMRFPNEDWYILPMLETGYYLVGAYFEE